MNELYYPGESGLTVYAIASRPTDNKVYNATDSAWEDFVAGSWSDYGLAMSETASGSGFYEGDFNPGSTAGQFYLRFHKRLGSSYAKTDPVIGTETLIWDGAAEVVPETPIDTATESASAVELVNMALTYIGEPRITSLTDSSAQARAANAIYNRTRDAVQAMHRWNSCTKRVALSELSEAEVFGQETKTFQLPSDFLRMSRGENLDRKYKIIAGNKILTNETNLSVEYIARVKNVASMDELLKHAIARKLAADFAFALKGDINTQRTQQRLFEQILTEARFTDSDQHFDGETVGGSTWLLGRLSRTGAGWADSV